MKRRNARTTTHHWTSELCGNSTWSCYRNERRPRKLRRPEGKERSGKRQGTSQGQQALAPSANAQHSSIAAVYHAHSRYDCELTDMNSPAAAAARGIAADGMRSKTKMSGQWHQGSIRRQWLVTIIGPRAPLGPGRLPRPRPAGLKRRYNFRDLAGLLSPGPN